MFKTLPKVGLILLISLTFAFAQTNEWATDYVIFDDGVNGTGYQTSSVGVIGPDRFVALVTQTPADLTLENLFNPPGCYIVGYWDADSGSGRVLSPINGSQIIPEYGGAGQFTIWEYVLDQITFKGAWQLAADNKGFVYVANNDESHNILVFELTADGLVASANRMETGSENIYAIEVDTSGYVYVLDYEGTEGKTNELKVFAGIDAPNTTWGEFNGHNDTPVTTIDLPPGIYQGMTVSGDGTAIYVSASSERSVLKFTGDPVSGYTQDEIFTFTLAEDDTVGDGGSGTPTVLGLAYMDEPPMVYAVADTFLGISNTGGYSYGRIYVIDPQWGSVNDTIDIAAWNLLRSGSYSTGSGDGRIGGYTSVLDVDIDPEENGIYTQTYYGWAVEKWVFDGDLGDLVSSVEKITDRTPEKFELRQNYPNPFNPSTIIEFELTQSEFVTLEIFNTLGQRVSTLISGSMTPGTYKVEFDASQLPTGMYFYQLSAGNLKAVKKMILAR